MPRSKPFLIAPFIPLWGILAFAGAEQLRGTRWFLPFCFLMLLLLTALFAFVANKTMQARNSRPSARKGNAP